MDALTTALLAAEYGYKGCEKGKSLGEVLAYIRGIYDEQGRKEKRQQLNPAVGTAPAKKTPPSAPAVETVARRKSYPATRITCRYGAYPEYEVEKKVRCRRIAKYGQLYDKKKKIWWCFRCDDHNDAGLVELPDKFVIKPLREVPRKNNGRRS